MFFVSYFQIKCLVFIVVKITYQPVPTHVLAVVTVTITRSVDSTTLLDYILLVYFVLIVIQRTWGIPSYQTLMTTPEANFDKVSIFSSKNIFSNIFSLIQKTPFFRYLSLWLVKSIWMNHTLMKMSCSFS